MKKIIISTIAFIMAVSMTACGSVNSSSSTTPATNSVPSEKTAVITTEEIEEETMTNIVGGWSSVSSDTSLNANKDANAAFEKATSALAGMEYEPIAVLGTQVVAGTNYCILCRGKATVPDAVSSIELVYIYADLQGNAEITGSKAIISSEALDGGFTANDGDTELDKNTDVKKAFDKAAEALTGADLEPVAYLGEQVVSGSNYLVLCKSTAAVPNAEPEFVLATVYADLNGGTEIFDINEIVFGEYDDENDVTSEDSAQADTAEFITGNN